MIETQTATTPTNTTASTTLVRPGLSTLLKNKIGKLNKRFSATRSKNSPALMTIDSNISSTLVTIVNSNNKPTVYIKEDKDQQIVKIIPHCENVIDLSLLKGEELTQSIKLLITTLFVNWVSPKALQDNLHIDRVSGAMTNAVFFVTVGNKRMLLRVYGIGCEQILDRNKELDWLSRLSRLNIGPKLLGTFGNGRFEEYLPSTTLTRNDLRTYSKQIASRFHQLHSIIETYPSQHNEKLEVWTNIDKWYISLVEDCILDKLAKKNGSWQDQIDAQLDLIKLNQEIQQCKLILSKNTSPIVFAHNDAQYGNILKINGTNELVVIDFEYAGYNPRGYDIVNHFCEWMYDYHGSEPAKLQLKDYPSLEQQRAFFSSYSSSAEDVEALRKEVDQWKMACHLFWALWGLIQASQSEIDFDYFGYSLQRISAFRDELAKNSE